MKNKNTLSESLVMFFFWFFDVLVVIVVMIESTDIEKET